MSVLKSILHHYNEKTKSYDTLHPETDSTQVTDWHQAVKTAAISNDIKTEILKDLAFVQNLSGAANGLHYRMRNGTSDQVIDLVNQLQATLSQKTVPSGNTGSLATLLSGIVHQIAALSGKTNWWEAPKNSFETLSAGVVAGDVSDPNSWWVKLGGTIPLIIQGGYSPACASRGIFTKSFPITFSEILYVDFICIINHTPNSGSSGHWIISYDKSLFSGAGNSEGIAIGDKFLWIALGI